MTEKNRTDKVQRHMKDAKKRLYLVHLANELVNLVLTVTQITALDEVLEFPGAETTSGRGELEGP